MGRAKVIDCPHHEHALVQRPGVAAQRPAPARQRREAFPERRIQPFDICRVDHPAALRAAPERLDACRRAIHNTAIGRDHPSPLVTLDDLGDQDMAPPPQPGPAALARMYGVAKGLPNGPDVGYQAIGTDQQGTTCRTEPQPLDQPPDQGHVALLADLAAQPQACLDHHGQCHPHDTALLLDTDLIGLHLPQVPWLLDQILVHGLALTARAGPPIGNGPLVKPKSRHNRLQGTPMGQQAHNEHHGLCRGAQPIEDRAFCSAEGLMTLVTDEPLFLLGMDTNIALADVASGMTVPVGAECHCGVHDAPPGCAGWTPVCFTTSPHHGLVWRFSHGYA